MIEYIIISVLVVLLILQTWWIIRSVQKFLLIRDLFEETYGYVLDYKEHVDYVHSLERYYGDETLKGLIDHGEAAALSMDEFLRIFSEFSEFDRILPIEEYEYEEQDTEEIYAEEKQIQN